MVHEKTQCSGLRTLTEPEEAAYRAFVRMLLAVPRALETGLAREQDLTLSEYMTLLLLSEAPGHRLRMAELAGLCGVLASGMTHIVKRMEHKGLIARVRTPGDGRGSTAVLTQAGLARFSQAHSAHLSDIRFHILDHLVGIDLAKLAAVMERMAASVR